MMENGLICMPFIPTKEQADVFTKGLPKPTFKSLTNKLVWLISSSLRGDVKMFDCFQSYFLGEFAVISLVGTPTNQG